DMLGKPVEECHALVVPTANGKPPASTMVSAIRDIPWLDFMALGTVIGTILFAAFVAAWVLRRWIVALLKRD
ncbi:hypothetical protein IAE22_36670, partial [Bacillus sp. S34]|nr:hypothetical protein [Bacillus sp. S34]